ncbi:MAG TPA: hypothetical protein VK391_03975 [Allosphingosinicella sp.]|nr:hypothetical protein [Allosphingosinicella sp.]
MLKRAASRRSQWGNLFFLILAPAALLMAAAPEALRLSYDPAALLDGSCLAPDYAGADCGHLRSGRSLDPFRISASGALMGLDDRPILMLEIREVLAQADEVTYGTAPPPLRRDLRGRRRP